MGFHLALIQVACATAQADSGWSIFSSIATGAATVVALWLGLYQWRKDRKRQAEVRKSLATALRTDLNTWRRVIEQQRAAFENGELRSEMDHKRWVYRLRSPTMPTFERFYLMLPDLGQDLSSVVVRAYTEIMRVGELIDAEVNKLGMADRAYVEFTGHIHALMPRHCERIDSAMVALKPYAVD